MTRRYSGQPGEPGELGTAGGGTGGRGGKGGDGGSRWQFIAFGLLMTYIAIGVTFVILQSGLNQGKTERAQICEATDAEHDARRVALAKGEYELLHPPATVPPVIRAFYETFSKDAAAVAFVHAENVKAYNKIIETRPPYCFDVRPRTLPKYPPLSAFVQEVAPDDTPQAQLEKKLDASREHYKD